MSADTEAVAAELSRLTVAAATEYPDRDRLVGAQTRWREEQGKRHPDSKYTCMPVKVEGMLEGYLFLLQEAHRRFQQDPLAFSVNVCIWEANCVDLMDRLVPLARAEGWEPAGAIDVYSENVTYEFKRA